jgi:hypothetical protein
LPVTDNINALPLEYNPICKPVSEDNENSRFICSGYELEGGHFHVNTVKKNYQQLVLSKNIMTMILKKI